MWIPKLSSTIKLIKMEVERRFNGKRTEEYFTSWIQGDTCLGTSNSIGIATELRAWRSGDRIPVGARFSSPVQTGTGAHPASCTMGTGSFPGVKSGPGVTLTPHPLLVPWSWKSRTIPLLPLWAARPVQSLSRAIPLLPLWAVRPVQSLSACTRMTFIFLWLK
jgi:hypothetical protein